MIMERAPSKMKGGPGGYSHGRYCSCVFQPHCVHLPDSWQPEADIIFVGTGKTGGPVKLFLTA